ncbi:MAG: hypothetical protein HKN76_00385, partial [Saprospiraceae bacterium]|nr:hypothetical protein [Saprospiraceae bacterium]
MTNISFAFQSLNLTFDSLPDVLPGTSRISGDISEEELSNQMMSGAHVFIERKISEALSNRKSQWNRNLSSRAAFEKSIQPNIARFSKSIGLEDGTNRYADYHIGFKEVLPKVTMQKYADVGESDIIAETALYQIFQVRWPSLPGVLGEGLLLRPKGRIRANVITIPDAGQTPEDLVGLTTNIEVKSQFARHLAENGIQVLVPLLISRDEIDFGNNQQTYREWIYRQAFHMGRHIIGFEVQKVRAAIDWFKKVDPDLAVGVAGYCEGGLIAYYSAAVDQRIDVVMTSGYFDNRDSIWNEPIYRNVFGFLDEFGDAEIAAMIAPRPLVVEYSHLPSDLISSTQKPEVLSESGSGYKGTLKTPDFASVKNEFDRINEFTGVDFQQRKFICGENETPLEFGSEKALSEFVRFLAIDQLNPLTSTIPEDQRSNFDARVRQVR